MKRLLALLASLFSRTPKLTSGDSTPYVCDECRPTRTNWYKPCKHAVGAAAVLFALFVAAPIADAHGVPVLRSQACYSAPVQVQAVYAAPVVVQQVVAYPVVQQIQVQAYAVQAVQAYAAPVCVQQAYAVQQVQAYGSVRQSAVIRERVIQRPQVIRQRSRSVTVVR